MSADPADVTGAARSAAGADAPAGRLPLARVDERRASFGRQVDAADYDRTRPSYPDVAVDFALGTPGPGRRLRVLDLGAGTGKLSRVVAALGHEVVALDPSEPMLAALRTATPAVTALVGRGEAVPLPDASVDAVVAGQAWHWVDPQPTARELARVLRPGGTLGLLWNAMDDSDPWVGRLDRATGGHDRRGEHGFPGVPAPFTLADSGAFTWHHVLPDVDALVALASTWSWVAVNEDRDAVLARVRALGDEAVAADGSVTLPQQCHVFLHRKG